MLAYFPQWQGSGTGNTIKSGAAVLKSYLNKKVVEVPLSNKRIEQTHKINAYSVIIEQLTTYKTLLKVKKPEVIKTIGGDCGLEIIPVSYLASKYKNLGVIWFDAHADFNSPEESPSCNFHGMPLRTLIGEGDTQFTELLFKTITPSQIHYLGLRDLDNTEEKALTEHKVYRGLKPSKEHLVDTLKEKGISHIYIHFDVDCLDPRDFLHSYYKVDNGLSITDAFGYIEHLKSNFKLVGSSLLESVASSSDELEPIKPIIHQLFD